ncbi:Ig-like domain-containing protein, partial [Enterobacter bugandensis]|uniref:Ig-like domain-containing protein n=1 Tax=Enterobacter bugandensis TaxID=881260 RepID=UPI0020044321
VKGQTVQFMSDLTGSAAGTTTDNGDGTYTATLTGTVPGTAHVSVMAGGVKITGPGTTVTLTALPADAAKSTLTRAPDTVPADGTTASTLKLTLHDSLDNPVKGQTVVFVADRGTAGATTDNHDGTYKAALTAAPGVTGTANITVKVGGNAFGSLKTTVTLAALPPDATKSTLGRDKDTILADETDRSTLTLTLHDSLGNPVKGQTVVFVADRGTAGATTDNHDGTYTADLTAAPGVTGTANITVKVGGKDFGAGTLKTTVDVTTATPAEAQSGIKLDSNTYPQGGEITATVELKDIKGNELNGQESTIGSAVDIPGTINKTGWTKVSKGTYTATFTPSTPKTNQKATLKFANWSRKIETATYSILPPVKVEKISSPGSGFHNKDTFPTTGFNGADFTIMLISGHPELYDWSSSNPAWARVDDKGQVTLLSGITGNKTIITIKPKGGSSLDAITWNFTLKNEFPKEPGSSVLMEWQQAKDACTRIGASLPTKQQMDLLRNEWGLTPDKHEIQASWTSESSTSGKHVWSRGGGTGKSVIQLNYTLYV